MRMDGAVLLGADRRNGVSWLSADPAGRADDL
jgi:hypothetical protein